LKPKEMKRLNKRIEDRRLAAINIPVSASRVKSAKRISAERNQAKRLMRRLRGKYARYKSN